MKAIRSFIISSILGVIMLLAACSKEDTVKETPPEKVPVSNFVLKTTTSFDTTIMLTSTALLAGGSGKYNVLQQDGSGAIYCASGGGVCVPSVTPSTGSSSGNNWSRLMSVINDPGPEVGIFFQEYPNLLNMDSVDKAMVINLFKEDLIKIVPAYSNVPVPASNQIQHFCIIEKNATLEKDYSNIIYVLQYRYIP